MDATNFQSVRRPPPTLHAWVASPGGLPISWSVLPVDESSLVRREKMDAVLVQRVVVSDQTSKRVLVPVPGARHQLGHAVAGGRGRTRTDPAHDPWTFWVAWLSWARKGKD
jgi:hypothetical protein